MSIHNTLFFKDPVNYISGRVKRHGTSVLVNEMTDNDYTTSSTETDIDVDMRDTAGNATKVTHIFVKYQGNLTSYVATPNTGPAVTRTVPTEVTNWEGKTVSLEVDGFKHDLFELSSAMTVESVRLQFTGTNVKVYALMLLELGLEIHANKDWAVENPIKVDRTGRIHPNSRGGLRRVQQIGADREKWEYELSLISNPDPNYGSMIRYKAFLAWKEPNPNCAFSREFTRFPDEVMLVTFPQLEIRIQPNSGTWKEGGETLPIRVAER